MLECDKTLQNKAFANDAGTTANVVFVEELQPANGAPSAMEVPRTERVFAWAAIAAVRVVPAGRSHRGRWLGGPTESGGEGRHRASFHCHHRPTSLSIPTYPPPPHPPFTRAVEDMHPHEFQTGGGGGRRS